VILRLAVFVHYRLVTDIRTDGQVDRDRHTMTAYTALAYIASRGKIACYVCRATSVTLFQIWFPVSTTHVTM